MTDAKRPIPIPANKELTEHTQNAHRPSDRPRFALLVQPRLEVRPAASRNNERHFRRSADLRFADGAPGGGFLERQELEDAAWHQTRGGLFLGGLGSHRNEFSRGLGLNMPLLIGVYRCKNSTLLVVV
jgi:hypothetical protein